jgi:uncharacterized protein
MHRLTDAPLLAASAVEREVVARDREMDNPYAKDLQVTAIHGARRYLPDRITRVAAPHRLLDPAAGQVAGFGGGGMHGYRSLEGTFLGVPVLRADGGAGRGRGDRLSSLVRPARSARGPER